MEESISRLAGSYHGVKLEPGDLIGAAHAAGRPAAERDTLYAIRQQHPLPDVRQAVGRAHGAAMAS
jgi:FO synthase